MSSIPLSCLYFLLTGTLLDPRVAPPIPPPAVEVIGACSLASTKSPPRMAKASSITDSLVFLDIDDHGYMADLAMATLDRIPRAGHPLAWLGSNLLWEEGNATYSILDGRALTPATRIPVEHVRLPRYVGPFRWLDIVLRPPPGAGLQRPRSTPDAPLTDIIRVQDGEPSFRVEGDGPSRLRDRAGHVVLELPDRISSTRASPGEQRILLSLGDHFGVANLLTGAWLPLPPPCMEWEWLPDGATLVGLEWELGPSVGEKDPPILRTHLCVLTLGDAASRRLTLPEALQNSNLQMMDVTSRGHILLLAEARDPESTRNLYLLELDWRQP